MSSELLQGYCNTLKEICFIYHTNRARESIARPNRRLSDFAKWTPNFFLAVLVQNVKKILERVCVCTQLLYYWNPGNVKKSPEELWTKDILQRIILKIWKVETVQNFALQKMYNISSWCSMLSFYPIMQTYNLTICRFLQYCFCAQKSFRNSYICTVVALISIAIFWVAVLEGAAF